MRYGVAASGSARGRSARPPEHQRRSVRLRSYDYAQAGAYFVTICTHGRQPLFNEPDLLWAANRVWRIVAASAGGPADEYVVMPNHVHGILWIAQSPAWAHQHEPSQSLVGAQQHEVPLPECDLPTLAIPARYAVPRVAAPLQHHPPGRPIASLLASIVPAHRRVVPGSLPALVRAFKAASAKRINNLRGAPGAPVWQRNYYEHIIRDDENLARIRQYILDNPSNWEDDPENQEMCEAYSVAKQSTAGKAS